jgi:hypothetical protein
VPSFGFVCDTVRRIQSPRDGARFRSDTLSGLAGIILAFAGCGSGAGSGGGDAATDSSGPSGPFSTGICPETPPPSGTPCEPLVQPAACYSGYDPDRLPYCKSKTFNNEFTYLCYYQQLSLKQTLIFSCDRSCLWEGRYTDYQPCAEIGCENVSGAGEVIPGRVCISADAKTCCTCNPQALMVSQCGACTPQTGHESAAECAAAEALYK